MAAMCFNVARNAIVFGLIVEALVLIGFAWSRNLTLGFFGGGLAGAMISFDVPRTGSSLLTLWVLVIPVPIVTLVGAAAGAAAAGLAKQRVAFVRFPLSEFLVEHLK